MNYLLCLVVLCGVLSLNTAQRSEGASRSPYVTCLSDNDCTSDSCCVISNGAGNGQTTICNKKLNLNDQCRPPSNNAINVTIITPDDQMIAVSGHEYLCPCSESLICNAQKRSCVQNSRMNDQMPPRM